MRVFRAPRAFKYTSCRVGGRRDASRIRCVCVYDYTSYHSISQTVEVTYVINYSNKYLYARARTYKRRRLSCECVCASSRVQIAPRNANHPHVFIHAFHTCLGVLMHNRACATTVCVCVWGFLSDAHAAHNNNISCLSRARARVASKRLRTTRGLCSQRNNS